MSQTDIRICFIGDSFVNGTGDEQALGWAGRLCQDAKNKGHDLTYYNLGVRRDTSREILNRWTEIEARQIPEADNRVVLSFGVNDTVIENDQLRISAEEAEQNRNALFEKLQKIPGLVVGPPPVADYLQNQRIKAYSKQLQQAAEHTNIPFIDLFPPLFKDTAYLSEVAQNDAAHPTQIGYQKIANIILADPNWWFH